MIGSTSGMCFVHESGSFTINITKVLKISNFCNVHSNIFNSTSKNNTIFPANDTLYSVNDTYIYLKFGIILYIYSVVHLTTLPNTFYVWVFNF